jgi:hypothetical protein
MGMSVLKRGLLAACTVFAGAGAVQAQYEMDQVLRIGYRLGLETYKPAYYLRTDSVITASFKDKAGLSNYEIWYCRYGPHAFYEMNIDGVISSMMNWILEPRHEFESQFGKFKKSKSNVGVQLHAIDYDLLNMKMAFGTKGIYLGGQLKWTRLGQYADDGSTSTGLELGMIGHSETNITSYGLGLHANVSIREFVTQTHLMYNWIKSGNKDGTNAFFYGHELEFESIISFGQGFGGYVTPFIKKRTGHNAGNTPAAYNNGFESSFSFGLKLGIYLAQESDDGDVYISVE